MTWQITHNIGLLLLGILFIHAAPASQKEKPGIDVEEAEPLLLVLQVERQLSVDLDGYLYEEEVFLPVTQLLSSLHLPYTYNRDPYQIGVVASEFSGEININFTEKEVTGGVTDAPLADEDFLIVEGEVYVRMELLEQVFGFELSFDYRSLLAELSSPNPLPVLQYHQRRRRYGAFQNEPRKIKPDIIRPARRHLFNGWFADWLVGSTHTRLNQNYSYGLNLGGHLLGGGLTLRANGSRTYGFDWDRLRGQWAFPFYHSPAIQQLVVGDQSHRNVLGGVYTPYRGVRVTNSPKAPRRIFSDSYRMSYAIEDGWDAELYVNNRLADVVTGSAGDTLSTSFPLRYGTNSLGLRYFSPDGTSYEQNIHIDIPRDFLPRGKVEYDLSAGYYRNYADEPFARGQLNWGLSNRVTVGGGVHAVPGSSPEQTEVIPFVQSRMRLGHRLIAEGSYTHGYYSKAALQYILPNLRRLYLSYQRYRQNSIYNRLGKRSEAAANTSVPLLQRPRFNISAYASARYTEYPALHSLYVYGGFSSSFPPGIQLRVNTRVSLRSAELNSLRPVQRMTDIKISKRLLRGMLLRPGFRYDHVQGDIEHVQLELNTRVFKKGHISAIARRNNRLKQNSFFLRFTLNLPFARHSSYTDVTRAQPTFRQYTSGTIAFDRWNKIHTDYINWVDDAAIRIDPFLDLNNNARRDKGEPSVEGVEARYYTASGRSAVRRSRDVAKQLAPYEYYLVQIDAASIDNPLWVPKHEYYQVQVNPNIVNKISVPIMPGGEVSGAVQMRSKDRQSVGLNRLTLYLTRTDVAVRDTLFTYSDGAFFQIGLEPGTYTLALDRRQLEQRSLTAVKDSVEFTVESSAEGDIVEGLQLAVAPESEAPSDQPSLDKVFTIQIGAFKSRLNAARFITATRKLTGSIESRILYDPKDGFYRCHVGLFDSEQAAREYLSHLQTLRPEVYAIAYVVELDIDQASDF